MGDSGDVVPLRTLSVCITTQLQLQVDRLLPQRKLQPITGYARATWGWLAEEGVAQLEGQVLGFLAGQQRR